MLFLKSVKSVYSCRRTDSTDSKRLLTVTIDDSLVLPLAIAIYWIWEKTRFVCTVWFRLAVCGCAYEISRRTRIFPQIRIWQQNAYLLNFGSAENVRRLNVVEFELRYITRHMDRPINDSGKCHLTVVVVHFVRNHRV